MELALSLSCNASNPFHEKSPKLITNKGIEFCVELGSSDDIGGIIRSKLETTSSLDVPSHPPLQLLRSPSLTFDSGLLRRKREILEAGDQIETTDQRSGCTGTTTSRGSTDDEDHHENHNGSMIMSCNKKLRLSREQSAFLEDSFKEHSTLNPKQKLALAKQLNLRPRQVEVWFQNRRARTKLKQTEVECDYLKRRCESLTEENRRLQKEVMELRALKTSLHPFFTMQQLPPPTTLTLCPNCERTAPTSAVNPSTITPSDPATS